MTAPRYDMRRLIATGGMGRVWEARDTVLDRAVAVKVLKDEFADDEHFRSRFAAEARHAARLQHPNVAAVLDYGEFPPGDEHPQPRPYLVMELVDGQPLSALIQPDQPMPADTAADLVGQAAAGIAAAHRAGIVHRDVKPANLLVTRDGVVKVTDFGVARAADGVALTVTGHVMGTPHYLSPEQAEGKRATPASDVYGLGIVLFECLAGRKPFVGDSPVATAMQHINEPLPPLPPEVPAWLRSVVDRATAKDPAARFQDAGELSRVLRDGKHQPAPATAVLGAAAASTPAAAAPSTLATRVAPVASPARRRRSLPWGPLLAGLLVLALGGLLVWGLLTSDDEDPTGETPSQDPAAEVVQVDPDDYLGEPYDDAADALDELGLVPTRDERDNPGGEEPDTVADVRPTGAVEEGATVVLTVWGSEPEPSESTEPTESATASTDDSSPGKSEDKGKGGDKGSDKGSDDGLLGGGG